MPGTTHRVTTDDALGERSAVMSAARANGDVIVIDAGEQDTFAIRMAEELTPRLETVRVDSRAEIGTSELSLSAHYCLLHSHATRNRIRADRPTFPQAIILNVAVWRAWPNRLGAY